MVLGEHDAVPFQCHRLFTGVGNVSGRVATIAAENGLSRDWCLAVEDVVNVLVDSAFYLVQGGCDFVAQQDSPNQGRALNDGLAVAVHSDESADVFCK